MSRISLKGHNRLMGLCEEMEQAIQEEEERQSVKAKK
jgi:hypothetical protein